MGDGWFGVCAYSESFSASAFTLEVQKRPGERRRREGDKKAPELLTDPAPVGLVFKPGKFTSGGPGFLIVRGSFFVTAAQTRAGLRNQFAWLTLCSVLILL